MKILVCLAGALICFATCSFGQVDSSAYKLSQFPNKIFARLNSKTAKLDDALTKQTDRYLSRLAKKERKIQQRLYKLDSNAAKTLFAGSQAKYASLQNSMTSGGIVNNAPLTGEYYPNIDSLKTSLSFVHQNPQAINASSRVQKEINSSLVQYNKLQYKLSQSDQIKEYIRQRKQMLRDQLMRYSQQTGLKKYMDEYTKESFYYSEQVREYKEALNDPDKMMQKALVILNKIPAFTRFMQRNSQLAGLFGIADNYGTSAGVAGLQTKDQVQQLLHGQIDAGGSGGMAAFQSNLASAHQQIDRFKDKLSSLGAGSGDMDAPEFRPNPQRTRSFLKRIQFGTTIQTTKANWYFPSTTNTGLSIAYLVSAKNVIGINGGYNIGWGSDIRHVRITNQGFSIGAFADFQFKKNLFISGGFSENYLKPFTSLAHLQTESLWQKSGLIGLSRIVSLPGKFVKKTKVSLLWDFLSYMQLPRTQAIKFQVGYSL